MIFTDGLVEAEDDREREYGGERMLLVVQTLHSGTAKEALKRIRLSVDAFVGLTRQHDDITAAQAQSKKRQWAADERG